MISFKHTPVCRSTTVRRHMSIIIKQINFPQISQINAEKICKNLRNLREKSQTHETYINK